MTLTNKTNDKTQLEALNAILKTIEKEGMEFAWDMKYLLNEKKRLESLDK